MSSAPWKAAHQAMLLLEQDVESGLRLYQTALRASVEESAPVPVFVHLSLLRTRGLCEAAQRLESLALACGVDISKLALKSDVEPSIAVSTYRGLAARGAMNAHMVSKLCIALARSGDSAGLAALMDSERLLSVTEDAWTGPDGLPLAEGLRLELQQGRRHAHHEAAVQSVRGMHMLKLRPPLDRLPITSLLVERIVSMLRARAEAWRLSDHPLAGCIDTAGITKSWVLYSDGRGYNVPHLHHRSWLTCTYYVACDPPAGTSGAGCLFIQPPVGVADESPAWVRAQIAPAPGRVVVMPSYYTHSVRPLGQRGQRIVIVTDLHQRGAIDGKPPI